MFKAWKYYWNSITYELRCPELSICFRSEQSAKYWTTEEGNKICSKETTDTLNKFWINANKYFCLVWILKEENVVLEFHLWKKKE